MFCSLLLGIFTFVELNVENLFDCQHDSLKQDEEWLDESPRHWNTYRYWQKVKNIGQEIVSCGENAEGVWTLPDMVALCEVENDSVVRDLAKRSMLRGARYEYVVTQSPDVRGIDVALLYSPFSFRLISQNAMRVQPLEDMRPTRDILYVSGQIITGDTLHVFVVHAPSRFGGERATRPNRRVVVERLVEAVDSICAISAHPPLIVVAGDFNESADGPALRLLYSHGLHNLSLKAKGSHGAKGTYKYQGRWETIDHILVSQPLRSHAVECHIHDAAFLLTEDEQYGGKRPFRNYVGMQYQNGFSDHLPLVATFRWDE